MMLHMLEQLKQNLLSKKQLEIKLSLFKLFKKEHLSVLLINPVGTWKSKTRNLYFNYIPLCGIKKHIITYAIQL